MSQKTEKCGCATVESLASHRQCPIEYDEKLNEYNLVSLDKKVRYRMYYCFFCGGKLPESKRGSLCTAPSDNEMKEVTEILTRVRSIQQAMEVLGKPDETTSAPKASSRDNGISGMAYTRHHRYLRRWKTLDLTLREREDGSFDGAFTGKYRGATKGAR
jgi:hypothetical protein